MPTAETVRTRVSLPWAAAAASAAVLVVGGLLPGFSFDRDKYLYAYKVEPHSHALLGYGSPRYLLALALALAGIGCAAWAAASRRPSWWPPAALLAGVLPALVCLWEFLGAEEAHDDPEATIFNVAGPGWHLTLGALLALGAVAALWLGRSIAGLEDGTWYAGAAVFGYGLLAVFLVRSGWDGTCTYLNSYERRDPEVDWAVTWYLALALVLVGAGALSRRWWRGGLVLVLGTAAGFLIAAASAVTQVLSCVQ